MEMSGDVKELFAALSKAQGELTNVARDSTSDVGYKYAQLGQVIDLCRDPLVKNDLAIIQMPATGDETCSLTTMIAHKSGQWIKETLTMPVIIPMSNNNKPMMNHGQAVGNAITYMRKYSLAAFMCVAQEDSDNSSGEGGAKKFVNTTKKATEGQIKFVRDLITQKWNPRDFREKFGIKTADELTAVQASEAIDFMQNMTAGVHEETQTSNNPAQKDSDEDKIQRAEAREEADTGQAADYIDGPAFENE